MSNSNKDIMIPAAAGFYALFTSPKDMPIPRRFFSYAVVAWRMEWVEIDGEDHVAVSPVCVAENGSNYDAILQPDGKLVHCGTGFTSDSIEEMLAFELDQEDMNENPRRYNDEGQRIDAEGKPLELN